MNRQLGQLKTSSIISHASETSVATSTTSRGSTIWGPGTLTGMALEAFGEATLRGVENLVIRRKLVSLRSNFPHNNDVTIEDIDQVYDDVLELSRPELYSMAVRRAALRLLWMQIGRRETYHLIITLCKWPKIEIQYFLSQIMSQIMFDITKWHDEILRHDGLTSNEMGRKLFEDAPETLQLMPLIDFITKLMEHNDSARHAALGGGFLDFLLHLYVVFPTFHMSPVEKRKRRSALVDACRSAFTVLSTEPCETEILFRHPVYFLWGCDQQVSDYTLRTQKADLEDRRLAWRRTEASLIKRRLMTIYSSSALSGLHRRDMKFLACVDIVEFSSLQLYDPDVVDLALLTIFQYILFGGNSVRCLAVVLSQALYQDIFRIISGTTQLWLEYADARSQPNTTTRLVESLGTSNNTYIGWRIPLMKLDQFFYDQEKSLLFSKIEAKHTPAFPLDDPFLTNITHLVVAVAEQSITIRWALLDAGALALLIVPFVKNTPTLSGLLDLPRQSTRDPQLTSRAPSDVKQGPIQTQSLSLINSEARKLLDTIRTPESIDPLQGGIFTERRQLCASLLDVLLGPGGAIDDMYTETRLLFREIFAG